MPRVDTVLNGDLIPVLYYPAKQAAEGMSVKVRAQRGWVCWPIIIARHGKGMPSVTWWIIGQNFMTKVAGEVFTTCLSGRDISRDLHPIIYVYATLSSLFGLVCLIQQIGHGYFPVLFLVIFLSSCQFDQLTMQLVQQKLETLGDGESMILFDER